MLYRDQAWIHAVRAHTFKSSHTWLCVLFCNLIIFIVSFPKSSLSHPLDPQVYFIVVNHCFRISYCGKRVGEMKDFVAMN